MLKDADIPIYGEALQTSLSMNIGFGCAVEVLEWEVSDVPNIYRRYKHAPETDRFVAPHNLASFAPHGAGASVAEAEIRTY